ncbi:unnamed protein product, partial [Heterosigma akashiwo]
RGRHLGGRGLRGRQRGPLERRPRGEGADPAARAAGAARVHLPRRRHRDLLLRPRRRGLVHPRGQGEPGQPRAPLGGPRAAEHLPAHARALGRARGPARELLPLQRGDAGPERRRGCAGRPG